MPRALLTSLAALLVAPFAAAHFVFVVPDKDGKALKVILSDDLEPDANVPVDKLVGIKLTAVSADGKTAAVECKKAEHCLTAALAPNTAVLYGSVTYGMLTREGVKPALLIYHPKVVTAGTTGKAATVGDKTPIEAVPVTAGGKTKFQLLLAGKPVADAEGSIIKPDGSKEKVKTDKDGFTASFDATGRYALWLRHVEAKGGEHDGKKFEETRHYATLVVDVK
jgi:uncharacterized GH25 family protein